jgi:lipopolysaccharide biosynthesis glycosyltransferase
MADTIHIAASCDDNYAQHVGVVFQSLLENTADPSCVELHLISSDISALNQRRLATLASTFSSKLNIIPADDSKYSGLPTSRYGTAAYQRISLAHYLPETINKVIYLDSDIVVLDNIKTLWDISLEGRPLAAVENLSPKAYKHLKFSRNEYFNSGVLVIDLEQWRKNDTHQRTLEIIKNNYKKIRYFDQCSLNMIFRGNWTKLPLDWNQQSDIYGVLKKYSDGCGYSTNDIKRAILQPSIVHFMGQHKPWLLNCFHPFKSVYQHYLDKTPWRGARPKDYTLLNHISYSLKIKKKIKKILRIKEIRRHIIEH